MILHCIFSHPFQYEKFGSGVLGSGDRSGGGAVDSGSESEMCGAGAGCVPETDVIAFGAEVPILTAEKIYRWLYENPEESAEFFREEPQFMWDDHLKWIPLKENEAGERRNDSITTDTRTAWWAAMRRILARKASRKILTKHWWDSVRGTGRM